MDSWFVSYKKWAEGKVDRTVRARVFTTISVFFIVFACFLAFKDEFDLRVKDELVINGAPEKPGLTSRVVTAEAKAADFSTEINGPLGYKARIADLEHSLGKTSEDLTAIQRSKPQVVVQTKEVPIVIPSGAQVMTPEERSHIKEIRIALAQFLNEGNELQNRAATKAASDPTNEANLWYNNLLGYLRKNLDESYVTRLNDSSDIPFVTPMGPYVDSSDARMNLWHGIHSKVIRLNQFITELSK